LGSGGDQIAGRTSFTKRLAMGLAQDQSRTIMFIEHSLMELFQYGWLTGEDKLSVTEAGRKQLGKWKWRKLVRQIDNPRDESSNLKHDNADTL
jgi:hypothetical protein